MTSPSQRLGRWLAIVLGLALGMVLLVMFVVNRQAPTHSDSPPAPTAVAVIEAQPLALRLEARGHGVARSAETWQAVANVSGRVVERHPHLENGALLREGTKLLVLDPSRYELAIAEAEAELAQLKAEEANTRRLLGLERQALDLAEQELSRIEHLAATGSVSTSQRDALRRSTVGQRQAVTRLENALALLPARHERAAVRLAHARRDLADTHFVAPYDLRLGEVEVELHQFVSVGQRLFEADSLAAAEVEARLPFSMVRRLLGSVAPAELEPGTLDLSERIDFDSIDAELELVGTPGVGWTGRVVRVASGLDPATRAVRIVVRVEDPWRDARPPDHPPLQRDMYTRVRLLALSPEPQIVVPASALHQGELYLVDEQDHLVRRLVSVAFQQGDLAVIESGLTPGERVIVDDLQPAIKGMALAPRRDAALEARLADQALGDVALGERP